MGEPLEKRKILGSAPLWNTVYDYVAQGLFQTLLVFTFTEFTEG